MLNIKMKFNGFKNLKIHVNFHIMILFTETNTIIFYVAINISIKT